MAARRKLEQTLETRKKIQTSQLLNRLHLNALSDQEVMTAGQIKSAEILLRKALPDLQSVQYSGEDGGPVKIVISTGVPRSNAD